MLKSRPKIWQSSVCRAVSLKKRGAFKGTFSLNGQETGRRKWAGVPLRGAGAGRKGDRGKGNMYPVEHGVYQGPCTSSKAVHQHITIARIRRIQLAKAAAQAC